MKHFGNNLIKLSSKISDNWLISFILKFGFDSESAKDIILDLKNNY